MRAPDYKSVEPVDLGPIIETPVAREDVLERFAGEQIARMHDAEEEANPLGGTWAGFEMTSGLRFMVMACPDLSEAAARPYRLRATLLEDQNLIWTPSVRRHLTGERAQAGEEASGWFQGWVEGHTIRRCYLAPYPTRYGGDALVWDFTDGERLVLMAGPDRGRPPRFTACWYGRGIDRAGEPMTRRRLVGY